MMNPIIEREIRTRMRTVKTSVFLTVYLLIMSLIVWIFFSSNNSAFNPKVAVDIYRVVATAQYVILLMILPAISAVTISGERERQTLELMLCTDISPWKIIFGKIFSSMAYIVLILIATLPFMGIVFLYGGVSILEIVYMMLYFIVSALMVSCIGVYCSVRARKTITSIIMAYLHTGLIFVGTLIVYLIIAAVLQAKYMDYQLMQETMRSVGNFLMVPNPFYGLLVLLFGDASGNGFGVILYELQTGIGDSIWIWNLGFAILFSALMTWIAKLSLSRIK